MIKKIVSSILSICMILMIIGYMPLDRNISIVDCSMKAEALTCTAPSPIAWQQGSYSESQRTSYLIGVNKWYDHIWKNRGTSYTIGGSACGIFSLINSVYYKTGNFLDPTYVADWARDNGFGTSNGVGTGFFKSYSDNFGSNYGFYYAGDVAKVSQALEHVRNGGTVCGCIPGHWIAIVDYNSSTDKYLILDSAGKSTRTNRLSWQSRGVAWVNGSIFTNQFHPYTLVGHVMKLISYSRPTASSSTIGQIFKNAANSINKLINGLSSSEKSSVQNPFNYTIPTRLLKYKSPMMNGDDVRWLQSALTYLGYGCTVDGYFGNDTKSKVMAYQQSKGLSVDGIVGNATLSSLKNNVDGTNAAKSDGKTTNTSNYSTPSKTLRYTSPLQTGKDVKWLQASLNKLIGAGLNVDGMFGKKTYNAVKTFQQINGLAVDGIVGTNTRGKINALLNDNNYVAPEASVFSITKIGYSVPTSTLRYGSKGDKVRWLQVALNCTIFSGLSVDGHYGAQTQNAVKKYQSQNGLSADGICGPKTLSKLKSTLSTMNIVAGGSAVPSVVSIEFANKEKHIYANEESIPFEFDSDSGETYQLTILDNAGNEIHKYVTDEYKLSVNLEPGEYSAYVTAVNDKGSLSSSKINFTVINQSKIDDGSFRISSNSNIFLSYDMKNNNLYADESTNYESIWHIYSYDDWTFKIVNSYYGKELAVVDDKLVAEDITVDNDKALWYLYEEDGMKFIKNKDSDMALTITSDGEVCAAALDISSYAQALTIENQNATNLLPKYTKIDDKISRLDWNPIDGADDYTLYIYGNNDEVYDIKEINTNSCEFETPSDWKYHIYIEANVGPSIIVGADFDDNTVILPESEENATQEPETKDDNEFYISMIIELNKYLLNDVGYDSMNIKDLDMNLDGKINVVDLAILKSLVK